MTSRGASDYQSKLRFRPLQEDLDRLKAIAASGRSGVAKKAQKEIARLRTQQLMREAGW